MAKLMHNYVTVGYPKYEKIFQSASCVHSF